MTLVCEDVNGGNHFFNSCRREVPPGVLTVVGHFTAEWFAPLFAVVSVLVGLLLLLGGFLASRRVWREREDFRRQVSLYRRTQLMLLSLLHRLNYTLSLSVALYAVFRQHRPCKCGPSASELTQVGSIYGMPSGDATMGGIVAALIVVYRPLAASRSAAWGFAALSIALKVEERLSLGFHSVGQVTTGTVLGVLLSLWNDVAPMWAFGAEFLVTVVLGLAAFGTDDALVFPRDSGLNLTSWWLWGIGSELIACVLLFRHFRARRWEGVSDTLAANMAACVSEEGARQSLLESGGVQLGANAGGAKGDGLSGSSSGGGGSGGDEAEDGSEVSLHEAWRALDGRGVIIAFSAGSVIMMLSQAAATYGWSVHG